MTDAVNRPAAARRARVLLTGFEPFGGDRTNPSADVARAAAEALTARGTAARAVELPCVFAQTGVALRQALDETRPELALALGLAGGTEAVRVERVALNLQDARIPDNAGDQPVDRPVTEGGPAARFATLPVKRAAAAVRAEGVPGELSLSAGTFVCNHLMYQLLEEPGTARAAGFVHVPWDEEHAPPGMPALPLEQLVQAVLAVVEAGLDPRDDDDRPAGTLH